MFFPSDSTIREHAQQDDSDSRSLEEYTKDSWADFDLLGVDGEYIYILHQQILLPRNYHFLGP